jgi:tRNA dimethylallyltransferase
MINAVAITGPTASGKTKLSLELAKKLSAEIISLDSMQIYRDMNIGTAKATEEERRLVPHHLLDFLSPTESYSTERYRSDALKVAREIAERGKIPLFVGGTGLYLDTLMRAEQTSVPESSPEYRDKILSELKSEADVHALWERLYECDRASAEKIHENNVRRVIRALEIYEKTGKTKTELDEESRQKIRDVDVLVLTLDYHERETLYARIDARVDKMLEEGLLSEVKSLYEGGVLDGKNTASQAIGYKELISYLKGEVTFEAAVELLKQSSRRYAKRQLTWFRHVGAKRIMMDTESGAEKSFTDVLSEAEEIIKNHFKGNRYDCKRT